MNTLRLDFINKRAPYLVKENPHAVNSYVFKTDTGTEFVISLQENSSIVPSGAYEFGINNPHHVTLGSGESVTFTGSAPDELCARESKERRGNDSFEKCKHFCTKTCNEI